MITKQEARAKLDAKDEGDYRVLSERAETALAKYHGSAITVGAEGMSPKAVERVMQDGEKAGWAVRKESGDQRDPGPWLVFS